VQPEGEMNIIETQKTHNEVVLESHDLANDSEYPSWESLPWPALDRIFSYLRTYTECEDLTNLAMVSTRFRAEVKEFMRYSRNRAGLYGVEIRATNGGLELTLELILTNLPFYDLHDLDWDRCHRGGKRSKVYDFSTLEVTLKGPEDPGFEQMTVLLSTIFCSARIHELYGVDGVSAAYLSMCAQLLRASTFYELSMSDPHLDDVTAPSIIAIASRADKICVRLAEEANLSVAPLLSLNWTRWQLLPLI
ncbi:hypothetical protein PMAYCL1PPCAC_28036, partial [Pristionchus mayeri]